MRTTTPGGDGIDVLLGGGQRNYLPKPLNPASKRTDGVNLVTAFQARGYTYVDTGTALRAESRGHRQAAGPVLAKRDGL